MNPDDINTLTADLARLRTAATYINTARRAIARARKAHAAGTIDAARLADIERDERAVIACEILAANEAATAVASLFPLDDIAAADAVARDLTA